MLYPAEITLTPAPLSETLKSICSSRAALRLNSELFCSYLDFFDYKDDSLNA